MKNTLLAIKKVSALTDKLILFTSITGKDSIVSLDLCAPFFKEILCVYMFKVPGLKYEEKYKQWAERKYSNVKFIETPHPCLVSYIKTGFLGIKKDKSIKNITLQKIIDNIKLSNPGFEWVCFGQKQRDSIQTKFLLNRDDVEYHIICHKTKKFYPLSGWSQDNVLNYIKSKNLIQPVKYNDDKSQSTEIHTIDYLLWVKKNSPEDLKIIFKYFPVTKIKLFEYEYYKTK